MTTVTIPVSLGGTGVPYNDGTGPYGMESNGGFGYKLYQMPMLSEVIGAVSIAVQAASTAVNAPGSAGTSNSNLTIGLGAQNLVTQPGKLWQVGQPVVVAMTLAPTNWMAGTITAYDAVTGAMTVQSSLVSGAGTAALWTISLAGPVVPALPTPGRLIGVQRITATQVYNPTPGTASVIVKLQGGGGAGGGAVLTAAGQIAAGSGGGAGSYAESRLLAGFAGVTVTIGAAGVPVAGGGGGAGGTTSFGAVFAAPGGAGGAPGTVVSGGIVSFVGGGAGGVATTGNLVNASGQPGFNSLYGTNSPMSGAGGASMFGGGAGSVSGTAAGVAAVSKGAGGSGGSTAPGSAAVAGGAGGIGVALIFEYA